MNKLVIVIIIIAFVAMSGLAAYQFSHPSARQPGGQSSPQPSALGAKISITPPSYDFGTVVYGDAPEYNFTVTNIGDKPLEILRLSTSCGCTEAAMAEGDRFIAPGGSAALKVTFNPALMRNNPDWGRVTRVIYIKSNDVDNPEIEAVIKATVVKKEKK